MCKKVHIWDTLAFAHNFELAFIPAFRKRNELIVVTDRLYVSKINLYIKACRSGLGEKLTVIPSQV